jgi:type I restriction enzyme, S subunit
MNDTPSGWRRVRLGEVAHLFNGKAAGTGGTWLRVFKTRHVYDGFVRLSDPTYAPDEKAASVPTNTFLRAGDTLTPNMAHGTIGRVAFVREAEERWTVDGQVMVIRPKDESILGRFLFDWMSRPESKGLLVNMEKGGAFDELRGQTHIYRDDVASVLVLVPPVPEQRKIAAILSSVDDTIETTRAVIDQLDIVKKAMMAEVLTRGLPGRHARFKQTEVGAVPEGWDVQPIGALVLSCDYGLSKSLRADGAGVAVLRMGNLRAGRVVLDDLKFLDPHEVSPDLLLKRGDVLFNRTNSKDLVGKVGVYEGGDVPVSFASYLLRLRVEPRKALGHWLAAVMNSEGNQAALRSMATPGVSQVNINRGKMLALSVPVPPLDEQDEQMAVLGAVEARIEAEHGCLQGLRHCKSALMSVLLAGEVRVNPDDEAA